MWIKKGHIFNTNGEFEWNRTHAQVPVADILQDRIRIYYATRNSDGKSNISYIEVDKVDPQVVLYEHNKPLFDFGNLGCFDDSGIMPSSIVNVGKKKFLYYIGWTTRGTVPYQNGIGLAISDDGGLTFSRFSEGPIISINHIEPYFSGTSFVFRENNLFKMYYLSCIRWEKIGDRIEPFYNIKYAESSDGINWNQTGKVAIDLENEEGGIVSASVIIDEGKYKMWFGKRKKSDYRTNSANSYKIGFAESDDGIEWKRSDVKAGIETSVEGWDSEMISYPYIIQLGKKIVMFYNGNGFGKTGFGYAVWNE